MCTCKCAIQSSAKSKPKPRLRRSSSSSTWCSSGGAGIYLLGHVVFKWLTVHAFSVVRVAAAAALLVVIPLIAETPALVQLGVVALLVACAGVIESVVFAESRRKIRAELAPH
jgi:hypothetical protein